MSGFYSDAPDAQLRFGDLIRGYSTVFARIDSPDHNRQPELGIHVSHSDYFAVLTPCCSIEKKTLNLAPLVPIRPGFLQNPFFADDLTRINTEVQPEQSYPPDVWERLPAARKEKLLAIGNSFVFLECFVYAPNPVLRQYELDTKAGKVEVGSYLVDFKSSFRVDCNNVERGKDAPAGTKLLQLSIDSRKALRHKIAYFFGRTPEEDMIEAS